MREELTLPELAKKYTLHPNRITNWKKQAINSLQGIFARKKAILNTDREEEINALHVKIGQMSVEIDF